MIAGARRSNDAERNALTRWPFGDCAHRERTETLPDSQWVFAVDFFSNHKRFTDARN